jgi:hypothetical protein
MILSPCGSRIGPENFQRIWFGSYWKWMQGKLSPSEEEDQTLKADNHPSWSPETVVCGQIQDCSSYISSQKTSGTNLKVGLCANMCFYSYCTKVDFKIRVPSQCGKEHISRNISAVCTQYVHHVCVYIYIYSFVSKVNKGFWNLFL